MTALNLVISVAVVFALMFVFMKMTPDLWGGSKGFQELKGTKGEEGKPLPVVAMDRARGVACETNLRQLRLAIQSASQGDEGPPASLADLASLGVVSEMRNCPVSGKPYSYDPKLGKVWCTTPGHENF
jgi:hypothetical protein